MLEAPAGVVADERGEVADPPPWSPTRLSGPSSQSSSRSATCSQSVIASQHRAAVLAAASDVVDRAGARALVERGERPRRGRRCGCCRAPACRCSRRRCTVTSHGAAHEVRQEAVQHGARRGWGRSGSRRGKRPSACRSSGRTPGRRGRPRPWRRRTASARQLSMDIVVDPVEVACARPAARGGSRAPRAAAGSADRRRPCWWTVKTNVASGLCRRVASSRLIVPVAFTEKSVRGSEAAQSWDGCAAVWITSSSASAWSAKTPLTASKSRMSTASDRNDRP